MQTTADEMLQRWADSEFKPRGFWNLPANTAPARERVARSQALPVSLYSGALADLDDKKIRNAAQKH